MKIVTFVLSLFVATTMYGQTDFSGNWKLNMEKSNFNGISSSVAPAKLVVEQQAGTITYQRNDRPEESLKIDSTASIEISDGDNKTEVSMKLAADKSGLIETRVYSYPESETENVAAKKTRTWSLSADKQTLTIQDHIEMTMGQILDMVLIYERQ